MTVSALSLTAGHVLTAAEAARIAEATQPWATYTPTIGNVTTSSRTARYLRHGDLVTVEFQFTLSGAPTGQVNISLPVNASTALTLGHTAPRGIVGGLRSATPTNGFIVLPFASSAQFVTPGSSAAYWTTGVPVAWASGDVWGGHFTYEAA